MGISRYPRPGYRIAPATLQEFLDVLVPIELDKGQARLKLSDLDETVWDRFEYKTCVALAREVISRLKRFAPPGSSRMLGVCLPSLPTGLSLMDLELEARTYNLLCKWGFKEHPEMLARKPVLELFDIPGFGIKCLVDLLTSIETTLQKINADMITLHRVGPVHEAILGDKLNKFEHDQCLADKIGELLYLQDTKLVSKDDVRLGPLINELDSEASTVWDLAMRLLGRATHPLPLPEMHTKVAELRQQIQLFSQIPLERELLQIAQAIVKRRDALISARYFGWDGNGGCSLKILAEEFGISKERIRQICTRFITRLKGKTIYAPALDKALKAIAAVVPCSADDLELMLVKEGITEKQFRIEGIIQAAETLGRELSFTVTKVKNTRLVIPLRFEKIVDVTLDVLHKLAVHWGVVSVTEAATRVIEKAEKSVDPQLVINIIHALGCIDWLDSERQWFWIPSVRQSPLIRNLRKILSVANQIKVSELRSGLARHYRVQGFAPPQNILLALCEKLPWCKTQQDLVAASESIDKGRALSKGEQIMVSILERDGPVMRRDRFEELCLQAGLRRSTFYMYLSYSPVITRYSIGVYGLIGAKIGPGMVEQLAPRRKPTRVILDYGWAGPAKVWICYRLTQSIKASGVVGIPASMKRFLQGEFELKAVDGASIGRLVVGENGTYGLTPFFNRRGGKTGDYLVLTFNLSLREAVAQIGDISLLEAFQW